MYYSDDATPDEVAEMAAEQRELRAGARLTDGGQEVLASGPEMDQ